MKFILLLSVLSLASPVLAQNTCFTDQYGKTLCSSPGTVIQGNTSSIGHNTYRDDRGNDLDFQTDLTGKASVQVPGGETLEWSQPVLGEKKYPFREDTNPSAIPIPATTAPGANTHPNPNVPPQH